MRLIPFILILFAAPCFADSDSYKCTIKNYYNVEDNGLLVEGKVEEWKNGVIMVDRKTGKYIGDRAIKNSHAHTVNVIDYGSSENAFEVVSYFEVNNFKDGEYLTIQEFEDSKLKPFHLANSMYVVTGLCE